MSIALRGPFADGAACYIAAAVAAYDHASYLIFYFFPFSFRLYT